ncbi:MAG: FprA family A-type flavoprotein [Vicinamibacteria bacterium]|nr:FprA family A-type flavoprotein [Vicinamibacteria bacterium]
MPAQKVVEGVRAIRALDWDLPMFDELIPLPEGTTYNAYLVQGGEKNALVDTVDGRMTAELMDALARIGVEQLHYIVANHAEKDHSGSLPAVLAEYPSAKLVTNSRCAGMLQDSLFVPRERIQVVDDGETLSLGSRTLQFHLAPGVHWPETMFTLLREDGILFTCDFLGAHFASTDLFVTPAVMGGSSIKRYFAEIMAPYRPHVRKHLAKVREMNPAIVAPSHGPLHKDVAAILDLHEEWASENVKNEVMLLHVSTHGATRAMADHLMNALLEREICVRPFHLTRADMGELAIALLDAATIVVASPTILAGLHPLAASAAFLANQLRPKAKILGVIGAYGWGGRMVEQLNGLLSNTKAEALPPVLVKGHPRAQDLLALDELADTIRRKHHDLGLL